MRRSDELGHSAQEGSGHRSVADELAGLKLAELLGGVKQRLTEISRTGDRLQGLLDAVLAVGGGLELDSTLHRIVRAAVELVDASYGALGVLDSPEGDLSEFAHEGIDPRTREWTSHPPEGQGILEMLIREAKPVRLANLPGRQASGQFPPHYSPMRSFLGVPVRLRDEVFGHLYLADKLGGGEFTDDDEIVLQSLAAAAGVAVENARLFEQSRLRERWLEAVATINAEMLAGTSPGDALSRIAGFARELSGAAATAILLTDRADGVSVAGTAGQLVGHLTAGAIVPLDPALAGVIRNAEAKVMPDVRDVMTCVPESSRFGPAVATPLRRAAGTRGLLLAVREHGEQQFRPHQVELLSSFASQAMLALEFADKQDSERQLVLLADRDRIGQDLHDHVIQRLFATGMGLQGVLRQVHDPHAHTRIESAIERLDQTVREIRTSIFDLHSLGGEAGGLRRRILDIVAELTSDTRVTPSIRMGGAVDTLVPDWMTEHAEAVVREGISNAVRHSRGHRVVLDLEVADRLTITIEDNGVGLREANPERGLGNLRRRARVCGGTLTVESREGAGTRLRWSAPLSG